MNQPEPTPRTASEAGVAAPTRLSLGAQTIIATLGAESRPALASLVIAAALFLGGGVAYVHQLRHGLSVTAMTDYFSWGVYIINFVFFIGISMAGSLISAVLRLTGAHWRHPITRMAEGITVFALIAAALMIVVDMGRPDRFLHVLWYGRLQSPILWDVFSLSTYLAGSILFLFLPLVPDFALLRDEGARFAPWRQKLYRALALGWTGSPEQHRRLDRAMFVMSIVIIPVAVSIHTVTAWLFGMTLRPGWHSTIIGPDFVVGALYSGVAAVIAIMALARWKCRLEHYVTREHFRKLGLLLLVLCAAYAYFTINEYVGAVYTKEKTERELIEAVFHGSYGVQFWLMVVIGLVVPGVLLALPQTRTLPGIVTASLLANVGMWLKRFIIVVPTLSSPLLPPDAAPGKVLAYVPTWVEWAITVGAFAGCYLFYCLFAKLAPIVSIWETESQHEPGKSALEGVPASRSISPPIASALALGLLLGTGAGASRIEAADTAASAAIALEASVEEGKPIVLATLTRQNQPVEGAKVMFLVQRTFGNIILGTEETLDDGTAAVPFPSDLPGGPAGAIDVIAEAVAPAPLAGIRAEATLPGALVVPAVAEPFPRALWAPRAPVGLQAILVVLLTVVWGAYAFIVLQLILIRRKKNP